MLKPGRSELNASWAPAVLFIPALRCACRAKNYFLLGCGPRQACRCTLSGAMEAEGGMFRARRPNECIFRAAGKPRSRLCRGNARWGTLLWREL
jgi:hypothetical protein